MQKRGLSNVVATVLIVLLALAAIAIVWGFISPTLKRAGTSINLAQACLESEVRPTGCDETAGTVQVQWVKGDNVVQVIGIIRDDAGVTNVNKVTAPAILGTAPTSPGSPGGTNLIASAAAVVEDSEGNKATCDESFITIPCT